MTKKKICLEISKRNEANLLEIEKDQDHVHFLIQSVAKNSPTQIITMIKSITAKEIFKQHSLVKKM